MPVKIVDGFWSNWMDVNAHQAIFHQWEQLEASGCIENFRIAAGQVTGVRQGWFFADSDATKWLEAAVRIGGQRPEPRLERLIDDFIELLTKAQSPDGYLFTYNQIFFPGQRWLNFQIEHELYCHGHFIEAGVTHFETSGRKDLLEIARKAADRIVADFRGKGPSYTPGHEEIEIALIRLHKVVPGKGEYLNLARQFIQQRGRHPFFSLSLLGQLFSVAKRSRLVQHKSQLIKMTDAGINIHEAPPGNPYKKPFSTDFRWLASALSGKFFQQHAPVGKQEVPVGHAVRFAYLQTAMIKLAAIERDESLFHSSEKLWEHMVERRMYVTGGIGSLPGLEGFGRDYELDPEVAYAETCAALACLFWNQEMLGLGGGVKYSQLFEWQMYNAALVGMGVDGRSYFYNNPLVCRTKMERRPWYSVPCCPSNLSRTWANLGSYIFSSRPGELRVHQFIGCSLEKGSVQTEEGTSASFSLTMESGLPWEGKVKILFNQFDYLISPFPIEMRLRQPEWCDNMDIKVNGNSIPVEVTERKDVMDMVASGFDPRRATLRKIRHSWQAGDRVEVEFDLPIRLRSAYKRVKGHQGKVTLTRGPLVYCLEDLDNPDLDIFSIRLDPGSICAVEDKGLMGGLIKLTGRTQSGEPLTFIPYFLWGNRDPSRMTVWINI
jgi:DUF1680 family protein